MHDNFALAWPGPERPAEPGAGISACPQILQYCKRLPVYCTPLATKRTGTRFLFDSDGLEDVHSK